MNENYTHPGLPEGAEAGIIKGMYLFKSGAKPKAKAGADKPPRVQLLGSGTILREVIAAGELLEQDWGVSADIWSCPSFTELRRDGLACERWNLLHPAQAPRASWVETCLKDSAGPIVASSDYIKTFAEQIRPFIPPGRQYRVLGTDGFGRSDTRARLRDFFEVDRHWVALAALKALADQGEIKAAVAAAAIKKYGIDPNKPNPATV
jgi:pyruvate dehydrogenase E1 component